MTIIALLVAVASLAPAVQQPPAPAPPLMQEPQTLLLWPNGAPGAQGNEDRDKPAITVYMPPNTTGPMTAVIVAILRRGTLATMPRWMRELAGLPTGRVLDALVVAPLSATFTLISLSTRLELIVLRLLSPMTVPIGARVLLKVPPTNPVTMTPREAQARYGYANPAQAHLDLRDKQARRVHGDRVAPSDEGLIESEPLLGSMA